jgi:hypothetical protein
VPWRVSVASYWNRQNDLLAFQETADSIWTFPLNYVFDICLLIGIVTFSWLNHRSWPLGLLSYRIDQRSICMVLGRQGFNVCHPQNNLVESSVLISWQTRLSQGTWGTAVLGSARFRKTNGRSAIDYRRLTNSVSFVLKQFGQVPTSWTKHNWPRRYKS